MSEHDGEFAPAADGEFSALAAFAEWCRANCDKPGQSADDRSCGEQTTGPNDEVMTTFCGGHMGAVIGGD